MTELNIMDIKTEKDKKMARTDINQIPGPTQENWKFIDELKKPRQRYFPWTRHTADPGEADFSRGTTVVNSFPDPEGRLDTALADWKNFMREGGLPETGPYRVELRQEDCGPFDSFRIAVSAAECIISAGDREGIRRGIYALEDLLSASDGPFLKPQNLLRKAWLKNRISRCFFGPIKRPPMNRDELIDDVDYYPDEYLNRLAQEGINGLWLTVEFKDLCRTSFTPDAAPDSEKRLAKLRKTVDKCLRYGIRTFIFTIEPIAWRRDDPILKRYPELGGAENAGGSICFCPSSETARKYLWESTNYIFSRVPGLGGIINISLGEKTTTCVSSVNWLKDGGMGSQKMECPRCGKYPIRDAMYKNVAAMTAGMRAAAPDAEFISWYYCSNEKDMKDEFFTMNRLPEGAVLLFNFESGGVQEQCGRKLVGGDYWLSYAGPSPRYERMISAVPEGIGRGAKLQVACSHELATVPYIPVPGLLYRKYKEMKRLGITTAMQCWYFGNYPGLMNKAAGMLAFEDFSTDETEFLTRLAAVNWGKNAPVFASIWKLASEAYQNYPFSNGMQYWGPFHDGIVWPLYPAVRFLPLSPTWRADYPTSCDMIGECLKDLPLEHAEILSGRLSSMWHSAAEKALSFRQEYVRAPEQQAELDLMEALDILFTSAHDIFKFYLLRSENRGFTAEMRQIMQQEILLSRRMLELCSHDSRLGFHSEAENYRFFPEKLAARARFLEEMLADPLPEVEQNAQPIRPEWHKADGFSWKIEDSPDALLIHTVTDQEYRVDQMFAAVQGRPETFPQVIGVTKDNHPILTPPGSASKAYREGNFWHAEFSIPWQNIEFFKGNFRLAFVRLFVKDNDMEYTPDPPTPVKISLRLRIGYHLPQYMHVFRRSGK